MDLVYKNPVLQKFGHSTIEYMLICGCVLRDDWGTGEVGGKKGAIL